MKDSGGISQSPSICKHAICRQKVRSQLYVVHEAAEEKAHGASDRGPSSNGGQGIKMLQNPSLGRFFDDEQVCIGHYLDSYFWR